MVFPYDQETYIGWDFENIWNDDDRNLMNDGYPVLYYQEPTDIELDTPEVEVELVTVNDTLHVQITWEAIDDANSYIVYASENPFSEDWGNPVAVITETRYNEPVNTEVRKFFHVVASIREP